MRLILITVNHRPTIEHLWLEIKFKNKNSDFLVGVMYHSSSKKKLKEKWLNKLDRIPYKVLSSFFF